MPSRLLANGVRPILELSFVPAAYVCLPMYVMYDPRRPSCQPLNGWGGCGGRRTRRKGAAQSLHRRLCAWGGGAGCGGVVCFAHAYHLGNVLIRIYYIVVELALFISIASGSRDGDTVYIHEYY